MGATSIVSPSSCALLVTIPLTRSEFADDWDRGTDFVRRYASRVGAATQAGVWRPYERYAALCRSTIAEARACGARVVERATLRDLAESLSSFNAVTVVAHSRGPEICEEDIVDVAALRDASADIFNALSREGAGSPSAPAATGSLVAAWLDALLGPADVEHAPGAADTHMWAWRTRCHQERWARRRTVEALCPGALRGGPGVEFHEGTALLDAIDRAIPQAFVTLDLTVCDSVLLAGVLRETRTSGVILANARPTTPDLRLLIYREALGLMKRRSMPYPDAVMTIRRKLKGMTCRQ